jgi:hypothetical protein
VARIISELREYIAAHAHAADTLQGVSRWWLSGRAATPTEIEEALAALVADGTLDRRELPDGSVLHLVPGSR